MTPSGEQHLSLSRTVVLRAHEIEPFSKALQEAVRNYRRWVAPSDASSCHGTVLISLGARVADGSRSFLESSLFLDALHALHVVVLVAMWYPSRER